MESLRVRDARQAMLLARIDLNDYLSNRTPNQAEFVKLYEAVQQTTAQYARLVKEEISSKYNTDHPRQRAEKPSAA
jgi:hypothetical protein